MSALFLRKFDPKTQKFEEMANIKVEDSIRTVSFNPMNSNLIAVGLFNGRVQIINISTQKVEQKVNLSGGQRVLSFAWHPLFESVFVTGSFDNVVRVHDLSKDTTVELNKHKNRVRTVVWNHELPWLLISACDDSMLVVWDLRTQQPMTALYEPHGAMTSLISHPRRPFSLISCHFDHSIQFWSLMGVPDISMAQIKVLLGAREDVLCDAQEAYTNPDIKGKLAGSQSKETMEKCAKLSNLE